MLDRDNSTKKQSRRPYPPICPNVGRTDKDARSDVGDNLNIIQNRAILTRGGNNLQPKKVEKIKSKINDIKINKFNFESCKNIIITAAIVFVLVLVVCVSIDTWNTNNQIKNGLTQESATVNSSAREGKDETGLASDVIDKYHVAPDLPRVLTIDKIKIKSRILPMSVNNDGSMQTPINIFDSGWYSGSVKPGTVGAAVIDGHASGSSRQGLFADLDTLVVGDVIKIEKGNNQVLKYNVVHTEISDIDTVDMKKMLKPYGDAAEGLNLITCTGKWINDKKTYDKRVLVFAERSL